MLTTQAALAKSMGVQRKYVNELCSKTWRRQGRHKG
jgi:plasmid maintenance system antidote protein VapI